MLVSNTRKYWQMSCRHRGNTEKLSDFSKAVGKLKYEGVEGSTGVSTPTPALRCALSVTNYLMMINGNTNMLPLVVSDNRLVSYSMMLPLRDNIYKP